MRGRVTTWALLKKAVEVVLPKGRFARSVAVLAGGTALGQAVTVLTSPILTRLYTPEDFGILAVYTSMLGILSGVASLRYELAIPLPETDEDAANLLVLSLGIVVLVSLLVGLGLWLLGDQSVRWANAPALRPYLWLLPVGIATVGTYQVFNYWAVRKQAFGRIARSKLHQGLGAALTQISLGFLRVGPLGLLVGQIVGQGAGTTTLAALTQRDDKKTLKAVTFKGIRYIARRYRRFPQFSSFSGLINSAGLQLPALLLASFYGPQVAGWFALAQRVIGVPMSLVGQAVAQVYVSTASQLARQDYPALRSLFLKTASRLFLIGAVPLAAFATGGPWLFIQLFGPSWGEAGLYMRALALMFLLQFVVVPLSQTLNILERQDWQLGWDVGRLLLVISSLCTIYGLGGTHWAAIVAYSLGMLVAYAVLFALNVRLLNTCVKSGGEEGNS